MKIWQLALFALFAAACTAGAGGGAVVALVAAVVASLAFAVACSSPGDKNDRTNVSACLSFVSDVDETEPDFGPCLSPPLPDFGNPDMGPSDAEFDIGPCLQPPPPDFGTDGGDGGDGGDVGSSDMNGIGAAPAEKGEILARLRDRLPDDVVARLDDSDDDHA